MLPALPLVTSLEVSVACAILAALLVLFGFREPRARRILAWVLVPTGIVLAFAHLAWWGGAAFGSWPTTYGGAVIASVVLIVACAFVAALPLSAAALRVAPSALITPTPAPALTPTPTPAPARAPSRLGRREVLRAAAVAMPVASSGTAISGFANARRTDVPTRVVRFATLAPELDGLRILQLSDLHLGFGRQLDDLASLLESLERNRPDIIVLTGDIAEDPRLLPPALRMVAESRPRLGSFVVLGNHEHLQGVERALRGFDGSAVPLLRDAGAVVRVGGASMYIAGIDDPVIVHTDVRPRLRAPIDRAFASAPAEAFHLLLAHRPEAFDLAAERGVALTLSGHTHGGQIGFAGKSAFEPLYPDGYLWGAYARGASRLYTTSGFGAWFPFRIGCPAEAPIIELARG